MGAKLFHADKQTGTQRGRQTGKQTIRQKERYGEANSRLAQVYERS